MSKHGGKREGAGRKGKAEEQKLIEHLTPMNSKALKSLEQGLDKIFIDIYFIKLYQPVAIYFV